MLRLRLLSYNAAAPMALELHPLLLLLLLLLLSDSCDAVRGKIDRIRVDVDQRFLISFRHVGGSHADTGTAALATKSTSTNTLQTKQHRRLGHTVSPPHHQHNHC
jgi:hypothetical protein